MTNESLQAWKCQVVHDHRRLAAYMMHGKTSHITIHFKLKKGAHRRHFFERLNENNGYELGPRSGRNHKIVGMCMFM